MWNYLNEIYSTDLSTKPERKQNMLSKRIEETYTETVDIPLYFVVITILFTMYIAYLLYYYSILM